MTNPIQHKIRFTERFKNRHPLRFHMALILVATVCAGYLMYQYFPEVTRISELLTRL